MELSSTQSTPVGLSWAADGVPKCLQGAALVATALSWVLMTPHEQWPCHALPPKKGHFPSVPFGTMVSLHHSCVPTTNSCFAGLRRRQRRGRAVRGLPSQEVQGPLGTPRLQALPVLCPHQSPAEVQLHSHGRCSLRGVPAGVRGAGPGRGTTATSRGRQGGAGQRGLYHGHPWSHRGSKRSLVTL